MILLGLAGCMVGPDFQKPVVDTPQHYLYDSLAADTVLNLEWWNLFRDSTLKALIDTALLRNPDVLIAASRTEEARAVVGYTKADMYPFFPIPAMAAACVPPCPAVMLLPHSIVFPPWAM